MQKFVCSLENAKRLAELGVERDSYFCYCGPDNDLLSMALHIEGVVPTNTYSVGELGEMLPKFATSGKEVDGTFMCEWEWHDLTAKTEADARAQMLIWLIEQGHVKAEDLNG